jgi:hypothetical protein
MIRRTEVQNVLILERGNLGTVQYLLKGRAGGKAKFHEKKLPALRSIK